MDKQTHTWLKKINVHYHSEMSTPLLEDLAEGILGAFDKLGHNVQAQAEENTKMVVTTTRYGDVIGWRKALFFTARRVLNIRHIPVVLNLVHITPNEFNAAIKHFETALAKDPIDISDFDFEGLSPTAPGVLIEQGKRGGPILSLMRVIQAQSKSIRILLAVGEDKVERVYHFDLVGAHPVTEYSIGEEAFYRDIILRVVTYESTYEVTKHQIEGELIPLEQWKNLYSVVAMRRAGQEMGARNFFTDMLRIMDLVPVPAISDAIADQYSEGCFSTWDPEISALIATITGSARPVDKGNITDDDLAAIVGIRSDGLGALVRHVQDKDNISPSSEAVEMIDMDDGLPKITLGAEWPVQNEVPVIRSKLHGHRGVSVYHPDYVEFVPLDPAYYNYLVSCATAAQAEGIKAAFSRAECLLNPDDPRQAAFTVLPGHGAMIVEKWVPSKVPFEVIWEYMDAGYLVIDTLVPQGVVTYKKGAGEHLELRE